MEERVISTEIIQLFSSSEAEEYQLLPYQRKEDGTIACYGETGKDYKNTQKEISTIFGYKIVITPIVKAKLAEGLTKYYKQRRSTSSGLKAEGIDNTDFITGLIKEAEENNASDIHFEPYEENFRIRLRIDGKLQERYVFSKEKYPSLINKIKIMSNLDIAEKRLPQDGRILYEGTKSKFDLRVSVLPTIFGEKIVLRLLTKQLGLLDIHNLGFDKRQLKDYLQAVQRPNGLVLISGPTGSGKSTTLYATLRMLNQKDVNILTSEDPIEYTLPGINQVQLKEDIGLTFASTLRTFLRQDPDIIMLGEIRDKETAHMAIRSSLTGHLLLSTIHTNSAWGSVTRLKDMGIDPYLIAETLNVCIAQRLVRILCPYCKKEMKPIDNYSKRFIQSKNKTFFEPSGCEKCFYTGYKGRKAIYEIIPIDSFLADCIRTGNTDEATQYIRKKEISTLKDSAIALFEEGFTSLEEITPIIMTFDHE